MKNNTLKNSAKITNSKKLSNFKWRGIGGNGKRVFGQRLALTKPEIKNILKQQDIQLISLTQHRISWFTSYNHRMTQQDITLLTRQVATMLCSGIPIVDTFQLLLNSTKKAETHSVVALIGFTIESGEGVSRAFEISSSSFSDFYLHIIASGEQSGALDQAFQRLADYREQQDALRQKTTRAMFYPLIIFITAILVSILMLIFVIPEFKVLFDQFGASLPMLTQYVLNISNYLTQYFFYYLLIIIIVGLALVRLYRKSLNFRCYISRFSLQIPILGAIQSKAAISRFCRTFSIGFQSGLPLTNNIKMAIDTMNHCHYQDLLSHLPKEISSGLPIHLALKNTHCFSDFMIQMLTIGEESGTIEQMLDRISAIYKKDIDHIVDNLGTLLEPCIMIILGSIVGLLVISMYLPIFNLIQVLN